MFLLRHRRLLSGIAEQIVHDRRRLVEHAAGPRICDVPGAQRDQDPEAHTRIVTATVSQAPPGAPYAALSAKPS